MRVAWYAQKGRTVLTERKVTKTRVKLPHNVTGRSFFFVFADPRERQGCTTAASAAGCIQANAAKSGGLTALPLGSNTAHL